MGIDVVNKVVSFNFTHEDLIDTSLKTNPTISTINEINIYSIFKRKKVRSHKGDGNPFIYALKRKFGYKISRSEIKKIMPNFNSILNSVFSKYPENHFDLILTIPSGHRINSFLLRKIRHTNKINDFFQKATISEVLQHFVMPSSLSHEKDIKRALSILNKNTNKSDLFTMKEIENHIRIYFKPLKYNTSYIQKIKDSTNILIIDDLLSTGSTFANAKEIIHFINSSASVSGLCLLSDL